LTDWWIPAAGGDLSADLRAEYLALMGEATRTVEAERSALVLRDYHAENLLWLPEREGAARVGLLDYQDALLGHPAYDLVSLLEDARRDLSPSLAEAMIERFVAGRPDLDAEAFRADLIPRVWAHFKRDLAAPHLSVLRKFVEQYVPEPTAETLARAKG